MRPRSAAVLACRIIAIVFGIEALTSAISLIISTSEIGAGIGLASLWAGVVTKGAIAGFLWALAPGIGDAIARDTVDEAPAPVSHAMNTHTIAFSVVGLIFTVNSVIGLISIAIESSELGPVSQLRNLPFSSVTTGRTTAIIIDLVRLTIGVSLLIGGGSLVRTLASRYPDPEPPQPPAVG
jgi:hypothetical protein